MTPIFVVLGIMFAPLAGLCAFVITFNEYVHHFPDRKKAVRLAAKTGFAAFLFFSVLLAVAGFALSRMLGG